MADVEYWIQIENRPWDVSPNNLDRMTGLTVKGVEQHEGQPGHDPVDVPLTSPETGVTRTRRMYKPLRQGGNVTDALILRRYTPNWAAPDDRKVNPWDLNEPDPTDNGTMGTIPGPVIECNVGDRVIVHFRNKDQRAAKPVLDRAHSLHPHGFVFAPTSDGAYPLSPPDPSQPVGGEAALWATVGVTDFKKGDRIPPGGTFTYTWNTFRWPTTAGVWLYHDHAPCDMDNVSLGAIGIIVIHNAEDPDDVIDPPLPGDSFIGSPVRLRCWPFPFDVDILPHDLNRVALAALAPGHTGMGVRPRPGGGGSHGMEAPEEAAEAHAEDAPGAEHAGPHDPDAPQLDRVIHRGDLMLELDKELTRFARLCLRILRMPPDRGLYLQLYHDLEGVGMCINGRKYLGNTPTIVAGLETKMRFGLVAMGKSDGFHTFHLHGHRWVIPGPDGNSPGQIQGSVQNTAVSQFEDTRTFGPANSFTFTINQGSFMGSLRGPDAPGLGEWHMHCHVLNHMMEGMMGSLLIVRGGELFFGLPSGEPCGMAVAPQPGTVVVDNLAFTPSVLAVAPGSTVTFDFQEDFHTVVTTSVNPPTVSSVTVTGPGGPTDPIPSGQTRSVVVTGPSGGVINYQCGIHGAAMTGVIQLV
jgi:FtsP/CotA-like multicopper oxidase with cupredoxin domain/plastocyanin